VVVVGVVRLVSDDVIFAVVVLVEARVISTEKLVMFWGCFVVVALAVVVGVVIMVVSVAAVVVVDGDMVLISVALTVSFLAIEMLLSVTVPGNTIGWLLADDCSLEVTGISVVGRLEVVFAVVTGDEAVVLREVMFPDVELVVTSAVGIIAVGDVAF